MFDHAPPKPPISSGGCSRSIIGVAAYGETTTPSSTSSRSMVHLILPKSIIAIPVATAPAFQA
jgi:hypothetical protein